MGRARVARLLLGLTLGAAGCGQDAGAPAAGDLEVNLQVARSADLVRWERLDDALPELPEWSVLQKGLTWASQGPFVDTRGRPLVCQERLGGSIDPHRFVDRDGSAYLLWKNDGNCCGLATELWAQPLDEGGLELAGRPRSLGVRNDAAWEANLIEAPTLWREGDTYYLFYSANDYGSRDYAVGYATATEVLGPYRDGPGNPILRSRGRAAGPGGQAVVAAGGDLWLAYHAWDSAAVGDDAGGQRAMWLDRLSFSGGRPQVDGPTDTPQEAP